MAAVSRLGYGGYGVQRAKSFAGKTGTAPDPGQIELTPRLRPSRGPMQRLIRLFNFDLPSVDITGTFATTEAADVAAFVGDVVIVAALATTEAPDVAAFNGTVTTLTGTLATTEAPDVAAFNGTVAWNATLATTEAPDVAAFAGIAGWTGTLATTEAPDVAAFSGTVAWTAVLATTEAQDVAAFNGIATWTGTLATTEAPDIAAFSGQAVISASLVVTEAQDVAYFVQISGDPNWANVVLLMGYEGANGSTGAPGMTDESAAAHGTGTVGGSAAISTAAHVFTGASSMLLNGTGDTLSFPASNDFNFGSGAFTIETSLNAISMSGAGSTTWVISNSRWSLTFTGLQLLTFNVTDGSSTTTLTSSAGIGAGAWHPLCIDFDGSKYRLYLDGAMVASSTSLITIPAGTLNCVFGLASGNIFTLGVNGYLDEVRITKGVARYASDSGYAVATAPFPRGPMGMNATLATTEAPDVAAFAGQVVISAVMATVEAADSAAFAGSATWTGTLATTEAKDVMAFTGSAGWTGTLAVTEATDIAAFAGQVRISAALAVTEAQDVAAFNGFLVAPLTGTLAVTEAQDTASFSGFLVFAGIVGTLNAVERADGARFVVAQPPAAPGDLQYGWPDVIVRRRL
jgi:Concanavalin A-like lectin/glucanases superfamily